MNIHSFMAGLKKVVVILIMVFVSFSLFSIDTNGYNLVWKDEFTDESLNPDYWTFDAGVGVWNTGENQEKQFYTDRPQNVRLENGALVITAARETLENGYPFTSGRIKSEGRVSFRYGIVEVRMKLPATGNGLWPAYWFLGDVKEGWPANSEVDIMEAGFAEFINNGSVNTTFASTVHWCYQDGVTDPWSYHAMYPSAWNTPPDTPIHKTFSNGLTAYHVYWYEWTPAVINIYVDSETTPFFTFDISAGASLSLEEFHYPEYVIFNLAVCGSLPGITDPALVTAPLPGSMYVDYIKVYQKPDSAYTLRLGDASTRKSGTFGVATETVSVNDRVNIGSDAQIYVWENTMTAATAGSPYEGSTCYAFQSASPTNWFGVAIQSLDKVYNMERYAAGHLHAWIKTSSQKAFSIGVGSKIGGTGAYKFAEGEQKFGLMRNGTWSHVTLPLSLMEGVDFKTVNNFFYIVGDAPNETFQIQFDNIYWTDDLLNRPIPQNGNYGIYTDSASNKTAGEFTTGTTGEVYVWDNTLTVQSGNAYEGANALNYTAGGTWFGLSITANEKLNMTAYENGSFNFALKTNSTVKFKVGIKSGSQKNVGQYWLVFENGKDPFGFVRDGNWHMISIPVSTIKANSNLDLFEIYHTFELLGVDGGISSIGIDNIYWSNGGTAILDRWSGTSPTNTPPPTATNTLTPTPTLPANTNTPTPAAAGYPVPGQIQAEDYTTMNGIQTEATQDSGGGLNVGWIDAGDWMDYTVNVSASGTYKVEYRVAATTAFQLQLKKGSTTLGSISASSTGGWQTWTTVSHNITLTAGVQTLRVNAVTAGWNFNWMNFSVVGATATPTTPPPTATRTSTPTPTVPAHTNTPTPGSVGYPAPGKVEAEAYATMSGIQTEATQDTGGGLNVGWIDAGDWMDYTINVTVSGTYKVEYRVASTAAFQLQLKKGSTTLGSISAGSTGGWQTWTTVSHNVTLTAGVQTLRVNAVTAGWNFNWMNFSITGATATPTTPPATNTPLPTNTPTPAPVSGNLALNRPVTVSSVEGDLAGSYAVDGNAGTRWGSAFSDPQYIYVDLGASYSVSRVKLVWEAAYGSSYTIDISTDASNWSTIYSTSSGNGGTDDLTGLSGTGRYVRMRGTQRALPYGYSLYEFEVYD
ncbi:MAG: carbohydrate-binding protein [Spirochaetales bacterium]|nr:carbohydrate-binding protein [Spirochaetales bacterium]